MLITEHTSDGRTIVRLHKDWNPSRLGVHYHAKPKPVIGDRDAMRLQMALLPRPVGMLSRSSAQSGFYY